MILWDIPNSAGWVIPASTTVPGSTFPDLSASAFFNGKNLAWCRFCTITKVIVGLYPSAQ